LELPKSWSRNLIAIGIKGHQEQISSRTIKSIGKKEAAILAPNQ